MADFKGTVPGTVAGIDTAVGHKGIEPYFSTDGSEYRGNRLIESLVTNTFTRGIAEPLPDS